MLEAANKAVPGQTIVKMSTPRPGRTEGDTLHIQLLGKLVYVMPTTDTGVKQHSLTRAACHAVKTNKSQSRWTASIVGGGEHMKDYAITVKKVFAAILDAEYGEHMHVGHLANRQVRIDFWDGPDNVPTNKYALKPYEFSFMASASGEPTESRPFVLVYEDTDPITGLPGDRVVIPNTIGGDTDALIKKHFFAGQDVRLTSTISCPSGITSRALKAIGVEPKTKAAAPNFPLIGVHSFSTGTPFGGREIDSADV